MCASQDFTAPPEEDDDDDDDGLDDAATDEDACAPDDEPLTDDVAVDELTAAPDVEPADIALALLPAPPEEPDAALMEDAPETVEPDDWTAPELPLETPTAPLLEDPPSDEGLLVQAALNAIPVTRIEMSCARMEPPSSQ